MKGTRRRILAGLAGPHGLAYKRGELVGGCNRPFAPSSHNLLCNLESKPFFAIAFYNLRDFFYLGCCQKVRCRRTVCGVHAHIQRRIEPETEAARACVDLWRRNADIKENAINTIQICVAHGVAQIAERTVHRDQTRIVDGAGGGEGFRIAVEREESPVLVKPLEDGPAVPAAPKRAINVKAAGLNR